MFRKAYSLPLAVRSHSPAVFRRLFLLAALLLATFVCAPAATDSSDKPVVNKHISGLVRDVACPIQNKKATSRSFDRDCLLACARKGSPLAILTDDGTLYLPISADMPDTDERSKLLPFVGKYVRVVGDVYERNGMRAIAIKTIKEDPTVPLNVPSTQPH